MPTYLYHCRMCSEEWKETHEIHDRFNGTCPGCLSWGGDLMYDEKSGTQVRCVDIVVGHVMPETRVRDIVELEGGMDDGAVEMPSLGPNVTVRTEKQRQELLRRTREAYFESTDGEHRVLRPFKNDRGEIEMDYQTTKTEGVDLGELVDVRDLKVGERSIDKWGKEVEENLSKTEPGGRPTNLRTPVHASAKTRARRKAKRGKARKA